MMVGGVCCLLRGCGDQVEALAHGFDLGVGRVPQLALNLYCIFHTLEHCVGHRLADGLVQGGEVTAGLFGLCDRLLVVDLGAGQQAVGLVRFLEFRLGGGQLGRVGGLAFEQLYQAPDNLQLDVAARALAGAFAVVGLHLHFGLADLGFPAFQLFVGGFKLGLAPLRLGEGFLQLGFAGFVGCSGIAPGMQAAQVLITLADFLDCFGVVRLSLGQVVLGDLGGAVWQCGNGDDPAFGLLAAIVLAGGWRLTPG